MFPLRVGRVTRVERFTRVYRVTRVGIDGRVTRVDRVGRVTRVGRVGILALRAVFFNSCDVFLLWLFYGQKVDYKIVMEEKRREEKENIFLMF